MAEAAPFFITVDHIDTMENTHWLGNGEIRPYLSAQPGFRCKVHAPRSLQHGRILEGSLTDEEAAEIGAFLGRLRDRIEKTYIENLT